jgi:cell division septation protein DedD
MVTPTSQPPATSNAAPTAATKRVTTVPVAAAPPTQPKPFTANQPAPPSGPGPLSLSPNAAPSAPTARTQVASVAPTATAPAPSAGGGYVVQVSSQRNEADAQNSYRALQSKYPSVLGSRSPFIKRVDLGDKGVYYRAMVGPFASSDEAGDFCGSLKSAGGNCFVQRN